MSLNDISFVKGQGGLGRPLPGEDHISGLLFYGSAIPSGFSSSARVKKVLAPSDAVALGIVSDYSDETKATATYTVTAIGANGDTIELKVAEPIAGSISLGSYTKVAGDTTVTLVAVAIVAAINARTSVHGYTASNAAGVITITARAGIGVGLNSGTPFSATIVGTIAGTLVAFSGGVGSKLAVMKYHIDEFFRLQPKGVLYVGFYAVPTTYDFAEVTLMQSFANGTIRQIGVYKDGAAFATADLTALHTVCLANDAAHKPLSALYAGNMAAITDLTTLTSLGLLSAYKASAIIGQDGGGLGAELYVSYGKSISVLGAALGAVAAAKVNESIAWVNKFNISNGTECDTLAFANGQAFTSIASIDALLSSLHSYRYIFLRKFVGIAGSYFNDNHTACAVANDYAYINDNRTIDKAIRGIYSSLLPDLNAPLTLNADGTLSDTTIASLESDARKPLDQMVRETEISTYEVLIDTNQNVASTSKVVISVKDVPQGVARNLEVDIQNVNSL
jgi:hypothetical protein